MRSLKYGVPIENEADKGFSFTVFKAYQRQLESQNQLIQMTSLFRPLVNLIRQFGDVVGHVMGLTS